MRHTSYTALTIAREHLAAHGDVVGVVSIPGGWQVIGPHTPQLLVTTDGDVVTYDSTAATPAQALAAHRTNAATQDA